MRKTPSADQKNYQAELSILYKKGSGYLLQGQKFSFRPGRLARICAWGPAGASQLLESMAAVSRLHTSAISSMYWPMMSNEAILNIETSGITPCFLASQNRYFSRDDRSLAQLFALEPLIRIYLDRLHGDMRCATCLEKLVMPDSATVAARILKREGESGAISVSAPLKNPGLKLRQKMLHFGFNRYWIEDRLVDAEDIEASHLWYRVEAVLIDVVRPRAAAVERVVEAVQLARQMGNELVQLKSDHSNRILSFREPICLNCLHTQARGTDDSIAPKYPDVKQLWVWYDTAERRVPDTYGTHLARIFFLLDRFSLSRLSLSMTLTELGWVRQGLLLMLGEVLKGGKGRFILLDAPFWGLDAVWVKELKKLIVETCSAGWGWIVAGDEGHLSDMVCDLIELADRYNDRKNAVAKESVGMSGFDETWPSWSGTIRFTDEMEFRVESGCRKSVHAGIRLQQRWTAQDWQLFAEGGYKGPGQRLSVAVRHQACRMKDSRRRSLAGFLGWDRLIAERMAQLPESRARGMTLSTLLGRRELDQCVACRGLGFISESGEKSLARTCTDCRGVGFRSDASAPRYHGLTLYDIMQLTVQKLQDKLNFSPRLNSAVSTALSLGFAHVSISRRLWTLSVTESWLLLLVSQWMQLRHGGVWIVEQPFMALSEQQATALDALFTTFVRQGGILLTIDSASDCMRINDEI